MTTDNVKDAELAAKVFLERVKAWQQVVKNVPIMVMGSREGGDLRRASMELTRALSKMRKP